MAQELLNSSPADLEQGLALSRCSSKLTLHQPFNPYSDPQGRVLFFKKKKKNLFI